MAKKVKSSGDPELDALQVKLLKARGEANELAEQVSAMEDAKYLPPLRAQYEGKWFKRVDNESYYRRTNYSKVLEVVSRGQATMLCIRIDYSKDKKVINYVACEHREYESLGYVGKECSLTEAFTGYADALESVEGKHFEGGE